MRVASLKFGLLVVALVVLIVATILGLLFMIRSTVKKDANTNTGVLTENWQRYDIPEGRGCGISPVEQGTTVLLRPNGEELQEFTKDYNGIRRYTSTGEAFNKIPFRVRYLLFRAADPSGHGKPYEVYCE